MKPYTCIWSKPWPESSKTYKGTKSSLNESPDHQGQSKRSRLWKWRKWSDKIPNWHSKFPAPMRLPQKNSRRTPSRDWSPRPWPPTCFSDITMVPDTAITRRQKTSPHGGNYFSKRRSESVKESRKTVKTKIAGLKTKKTKSTRVKESWKMKADKVKNKRKYLKRSETKREEKKR